MTGSVVDLQWGSVDGVHAIWTESDVPFTGGISFRMGRVDESLRHAGISHLAAHLALARFGDQAAHEHGSTDAAFTSFSASGDEETASDFLQHAVRNAARFEAARLGSEAKVAEQEARGVLPTTESLLLWTRFGASGFGLTHVPEYAIRVVDPLEVADWATAHFVRNNAAFWFTGTPPRWLEVPLADGEWKAPPSIQTVAAASRPCVFHGGSGLVAASFVVPRDAAAECAVRILARTLNVLLAVGAVPTRSVSVESRSLSAEMTHVAVVISCLDSYAAMIGQKLLDTIERLIRGLTPFAIAQERAAMEAELMTPEAAVTVAREAAERLLYGGQPETTEHRLRAWNLIDPAAVIAELATATHSLLLMLPEAAPWSDGRLPMMAATASRSVEGRQFRRRNGDGGGGGSELILSEDGITLSDANGTPRTVRFGAMAGMLRTSAGVRVLVGTDGTSLRIATEEWKDGSVAADFLDRVIPPALSVPLDRQPSTSAA